MAERTTPVVDADRKPLQIGGVAIRKRPQDLVISLRDPFQLDDDEIWPQERTAPPDQPYRQRHGNPLLT